MGLERAANLEVDPCEDPLLELIAEEDRELVRDLVQALPARQREVVTLHLDAGLTFQQIADELDEPLWTVTSRYRRTLNRLRDALKDRQRPGPRLPR
jgi:RNA polymerase sigma factor (sigma-70 family)